MNIAIVTGASSGIGKVFAAMCAQTMIVKFGADTVINTGVAGGLGHQQRILQAHLKGAAADDGGLGTQVQSCQIDVGFLAPVFQNGNPFFQLFNFQNVSV